MYLYLHFFEKTATGGFIVRTKCNRVLAILLSLLCLLPMVSLAGQAAGTLDYPVVYVAGKFTYIYNKKNTERLYPLKTPLSTTIMNNRSELIAAYNASSSSGDWTIFGDKIYDIVEPEYRELVLDTNGDITNGSHVNAVAAPKNKTSNFALEDYMFTYDSRLDPYENAAALNNYIKKVLQVTGKSKVNLIGRCLGTTIISTYLTKYGCSKVASAIFYASAFNGVQMMDDFFTGNIEFEQNRISYYIAHGMDTEGDTYQLISNVWSILTALGLAGAGVNTANEVWDRIAPDLLPKLVRAVFGTWPGHWAMISAGAYQKAKNIVFSKCMAKYAGLIKKIDKYQKEVMSKWPDTLNRLVREDGLRVAIFAKYNTPLAPLSNESGQQADGTVELETMSLGAKAADIGETFSSAYIQYLKNTGKSKYLSADLMVDASTCQYPDYTWFIRDVAHDAYPPEINSLFMDIFHSSTQYTVTTDSKYPQFVSYNEQTQKISKITEPVTGAETPGKNILQIIAAYITQLFAKLFSLFGGNKTAQ